MDDAALVGAQVELTAPDGRVFRFRVVSLVPYAAETYAVLEHAGEDGALLVTHVEEDVSGAPVFVVAGEEDVITAVLEKQVAQTIARAMADARETDAPAEEAGGCACGHEPGNDGCRCGHDHPAGEDCQHGQKPDGCACGQRGFHRPCPSSIKRPS